VLAGDAAVALDALPECAADRLEELREARDELEARLLVRPAERTLAALEDGPAGLGNIVGIGIGGQEVEGRPTGRLSVKVLVREKRRRRQVASEALVPARLGGLPTDVEAAGRITAQHYTERHRPAPCGVSIGSCNFVTPGTLGCVVRRGRTRYILGTNHILALLNRGPIGVGIPQPGRLDGGRCAGDVIARLSRFVPIVRDRPNLVDAAIARTAGARVDARVLRPEGVLQPLAAPEVPPALGTQVQKSGRSTHYSTGHIDAIDVTVDVDYGPLGGTIRFSNQFRVRGTGGPFSNNGDSGALVTTVPGNQPVGLLFSGNPRRNMSFCNDIAEVTRALDVSIVY
jgi:hypothetical protein